MRGRTRKARSLRQVRGPFSPALFLPARHHGRRYQQRFRREYLKELTIQISAFARQTGRGSLRGRLMWSCLPANRRRPSPTNLRGKGPGHSPARNSGGTNKYAYPARATNRPGSGLDHRDRHSVSVDRARAMERLSAAAIRHRRLSCALVRGIPGSQPLNGLRHIPASGGSLALLAHFGCPGPLGHVDRSSDPARVRHRAPHSDCRRCSRPIRHDCAASSDQPAAD